MKIITPIIALVVAAITVQAREMYYGTAAAEFAVKATVDSFTGHAASRPFSIGESDESVTVVYDIAAMETGKKKRDKEMMHMFHADEYPVITGTASAADLLALDPAQATNELDIVFVIHGITNTVTARASHIESGEGARAFDLDFPLTLSAFELKAPSVLGLIRVADVVQVTTHVALTANPPAE